MPDRLLVVCASAMDASAQLEQVQREQERLRLLEVPPARALVAALEALRALGVDAPSAARIVALVAHGARADAPGLHLTT